MIWFKYLLFISTKVTFFAPLLAASKPIIPEPANISKNDFSFKEPIVSKKLFQGFCESQDFKTFSYKYIATKYFTKFKNYVIVHNIN